MAASVYARTSPPVPSRVPPKYLVTTIQTFVIPAPSITESMGFPAVPCGSLDISLYRDDLNSISESEADTPVIRKSCLPFEIVNKNVIIVDDVLYTGRTVRSAIDAVFTMGRPKAIRLAILIDRGHRELPIRADYIGKSIPTSASERVSVMLPPYDSDTGVVLYG